MGFNILILVTILSVLKVRCHSSSVHPFELRRKTSNNPYNSTKICQYGGYCLLDSDCVFGNKCTFKDDKFYSQCLPDPTQYLFQSSTGCLLNFDSQCDDNTICCDPGSSCNNRPFRQCSQLEPPICWYPNSYEEGFNSTAWKILNWVPTAAPVTLNPAHAQTTLFPSPTSFPYASPTHSPFTTPTEIPTTQPLATAGPTNEPTVQLSFIPSVVQSPSPTAALSSLICQFGGYCKADSDCVPGNKCYVQNDKYSQCIPDPSMYLTGITCVQNNGAQCSDNVQCCDPGATCNNNIYRQCVQPQSPNCSTPVDYGNEKKIYSGHQLVFGHVVHISGMTISCSALMDDPISQNLVANVMAEMMEISLSEVIFSSCNEDRRRRLQSAMPFIEYAIETTTSVPLHSNDISIAASLYATLANSVASAAAGTDSLFGQTLITIAAALGKASVFPSSTVVDSVQISAFSPSFVVSNETLSPSQDPSFSPTFTPTSFSSIDPSNEPTSGPTLSPTLDLTTSPTGSPTTDPTYAPSELPSMNLTLDPSSEPSIEPSLIPSLNPTLEPSSAPTIEPSLIPSLNPTLEPSSAPTIEPSFIPSLNPTLEPSSAPTIEPTCIPSLNPTLEPSSEPSIEPSFIPSVDPTIVPTMEPSAFPSIALTNPPSKDPSAPPTSSPSTDPTNEPVHNPSAYPTTTPSSIPTVSPTSTSIIIPLSHPGTFPSDIPSEAPTSLPSSVPSPTAFPTSILSESPTSTPPSSLPTTNPVFTPSDSPREIPSDYPVTQPSYLPSTQPSGTSSESPSVFPTLTPSFQPNTDIPSSNPSSLLTTDPTSEPTSISSTAQTPLPISLPSSYPIVLPSLPPITSPSLLSTETPSAKPYSNPASLPTTIPTLRIESTLKPTIGPTKPFAIEFESLLVINSLPEFETTLDNSSRIALAETVDLCLKIPIGSSYYLSDTYYVNGKPQIGVAKDVSDAMIVSHVKTTVKLSLFPSYSDSPTALFSQLRANLSTSISNGEFVKVLNSVSLVKYALLTSTATLQGNMTSINLAIIHPTRSPTSNSGESIQSSSSTSFSSKRTATITASVVIVSVVLIIAIAVFAYGLRKKKMKSDQIKFSNDNAMAAVDSSLQNNFIDELKQSDDVFVFNFGNQRRQGDKASDFKFYLEKDSSPLTQDKVAGMNATINSGDSVQYELDQSRLGIDGEIVNMASFSEELIYSPRKR